MKTVTCPVCYGAGRPEDELWLCRADRAMLEEAKKSNPTDYLLMKQTIRRKERK